MLYVCNYLLSIYLCFYIVVLVLWSLNISKLNWTEKNELNKISSSPVQHSGSSHCTQMYLSGLLNTLLCPSTKIHSLYAITSSSNCRSRWSWASNWQLWSSRICMRASNRPLCSRSNLASANMSQSGGLGPPGRCEDPSGVEPGVCLACKRSYSAWRVAFSSSNSL